MMGPLRAVRDSPSLVSTNGIADQWPRPESDAQDDSKGYVKQQHPRSQAKDVAQAPDEQGHERPAHDSGAQDSGKRPVMGSNRIEPERNQRRPHDRSEQPDARERDAR